MARFYEKSGRINTVKSIFLILAASGLFLVMSGCDKKAKENTARKNRSDKTSVLSDKPLAAYQSKLLDIAFDTASSIPIKPHIKDRSKAQDAVVTTCLQLDQPKRALDYIEKIADWRQGACYADLAFYCAQHGDLNDVIQRYLKLADKISETADQDWRRDRIKVKIAQTHVLLGHTREANELEAGVDNSETGKVAKAKVMVADTNSFNEQMKMMDTLIATEVFDTVKNALDSSTELFNRFYEDEEKRTQVEEKIKASWGKMPVTFKMEILTTLAGFAMDHADKNKAIELINEAQSLLDSHEWPPEDKIPRLAKLIKFRCRIDDFGRAATDADAALALYNKNRYFIMNIDRAGVLRPLAEAYQTMGDTKAALSVYKKAIEEGVENPNSRPRAEDLTATCCSMALHSVEPDAELWIRIYKIREALGEPW